MGRRRKVTHYFVVEVCNQIVGTKKRVSILPHSHQQILIIGKLKDSHLKTLLISTENPESKIILRSNHTNIGIGIGCSNDRHFVFKV